MHFWATSCRYRAFEKRHIANFYIISCSRLQESFEMPTAMLNVLSVRLVSLHQPHLPLFRWNSLSARSFRFVMDLRIKDSFSIAPISNHSSSNHFQNTATEGIIDQKLALEAMQETATEVRDPDQIRTTKNWNTRRWLSKSQWTTSNFRSLLNIWMAVNYCNEIHGCHFFEDITSIKAIANMCNQIWNWSNVHSNRIFGRYQPVLQPRRGRWKTFFPERMEWLPDFVYNNTSPSKLLIDRGHVNLGREAFT